MRVKADSDYCVITARQRSWNTVQSLLLTISPCSHEFCSPPVLFSFSLVIDDTYSEKWHLTKKSASFVAVLICVNP